MHTLSNRQLSPFPLDTGFVGFKDVCGGPKFLLAELNATDKDQS
jgi:hypothetical protein